MSTDPALLRACLRWLSMVGPLVPRTLRADWRQEWEAEVRHRWRALAERGGLDWKAQAGLLRRALGALPDAAWLRQQLTADAEMLRDVRHGLRLLRREPGFTLAAVVITALAIGANTVVFGAVDALLLRDPPYPAPDRIVVLWQKDGRRGLERDDVAPANFLDWRERARSFEAVAAVEPYSFDDTDLTPPEVLFAARVTEGFFDVFGARPLLGRTLRPEDHRPGAPHVVVLSYGLWQRRFGGDPSLVGRTIGMDNEAHTVVGVLPADFQPRLLPTAGERGVWVPKAIAEHDRRVRGSAWWNVAGRLRPGVRPAEAQAELDAIAAALGREHPRTNRDVGIALQPLREHLAGPAGPALLVLWGAVAMVLAIACANVAGLLLARGFQRDHELAVRAALGASRARLARQFVAEGLLLAGIGAVAGVLLARWGSAALVGLLPAGLPRVDQIGLNGRVLAFTALATGLSGLVFGLVPAARLAGRRIALTRAGRTTTGSRARRLSGILVMGEVALALVLVAGAGLLLRSFSALLAVDPGFRSDGVLMLQVFAWDRHTSPVQRASFFQQTLERIEALPGVEAAGAVSTLPFSAVDYRIDSPLGIEGRPTPPGEEPSAHVSVATPGSFAALRIPLRRGRLLSPDDGASAPRVALVNETLAKRYWSGQDPLGARLSFRWEGRPLTAEVVGVVGAVRHEGLEHEGRGEVIVPHAQLPTGGMCYVVRTPGSPSAQLQAVKEQVWAVDPQQTFYQTARLEELMAASLAPRRCGTLLVAALAAAAVGLAALGLYGLVSLATRQRTREIGVRLTLGARRADVLRMVLGQGLVPVAAGLLLGLGGAVSLSRAFRGLLYGVSPTDPGTLAAVCAVVLAVCLGAGLIGARRAARLDPLSALRAE